MPATEGAQEGEWMARGKIAGKKKPA